MRLRALLQLRCPHCLRGPIFHGVWRMHPNCPVCGAKYEREEGYFMMAIFFGYILGFVAILPFAIWLYLVGAALPWYFFVSLTVLLILSPLIFRYSRAIWMHLDELLDPRRPPKPG
ncbi:MAG: DUF983 domain-containing protein [Ardenticatenaceae bacterium]|nr:DUF983 domain-containing protein [Ardenticatenaceae bacterium]